MIALPLRQFGRGVAFATWVVGALIMLSSTSAVYARTNRPLPEEPAFSWRGTLAARTGTFEVGPGKWEFCPSLLSRGRADNPTNMLVSLYTGDGVWLKSDSGAGGPGTLGCTPIDKPGQYDLRVSVSPGEGTSWTMVVQRRGTGQPQTPELPAWRTDWAIHAAPTRADGDTLLFEGSKDTFTAFFRPVGDTWTICWDLDAAPPPDAANNSQHLDIAVLIESEGRIESVQDRSRTASSECKELKFTQYVARHFLVIQAGSQGRAWRVRVSGVELVK